MAAPADPLLASHIWNAYRTTEQNPPDQELDHERPAKRRRLLTSCKSVDDALRDGLSYGDGGLCCISAEKGAGGPEVSDQATTLSAASLVFPTLSAMLKHESNPSVAFICFSRRPNCSLDGYTSN